mgnify:CR=1 FL=1
MLKKFIFFFKVPNLFFFYLLLSLPASLFSPLILPTHNIYFIWFLQRLQFSGQNFLFIYLFLPEKKKKFFCQYLPILCLNWDELSRKINPTIFVGAKLNAPIRASALSFSSSDPIAGAKVFPCLWNEQYEYPNRIWNIL